MTSLLCLVLVAGLSDPPAGLPGPGDRLPENEIKSTLQPPPVLATEVLASDSPILPSRRVLPQREWPNVWGYTGTRLITYGSKIAPNGVEYDPYFTFDLDINIEALPERELYLTVQNAFWTQRPGVGITNPA